jgi:hypothetical protein
MANFNFKSPSVKFQEIDRSFASTPSLGITSVGMVGETLKGPAFSPILVTDKSEFRRYFGGTSTEKFPGTSKLKYLGPTYANAFLEEGNQLYYTRILGKSGYDAGPAWIITVGSGPISSGLSSTYVETAATFFSSNTFTLSGVSITADALGLFDNSTSFTFTKTGNMFSGVVFYLDVTAYTATATTGFTLYTAFTYTAATDPKFENMAVALLRSRPGANGGSLTTGGGDFRVTGVTGDFSNTIGNALENFTLSAGTDVGGLEVLNFNLDVTSSSFITKAMGRKVTDTKASLFCEAVFPDLIRKLATEDSIYHIKDVIAINTNSAFDSYQNTYTNPETPWIVSEINGNKISRLFKFVSYSDGDSANREVKISIENINPTTKEFDVIVRDYNDTDANPSTLERFGRCNMNPNSNNFVMRRIGGVYSDNTDTFLEDARSSYVYVNVNVTAPSNSIPCGFEGYELPFFDGTTMANPGYSAVTPLITYKTSYSTTDKPLKTYLGVSEKAYDTSSTKGLSINDDFFKFYGPEITVNNDASIKSKGFHLDSGATGNYVSEGIVIGEFEVGAGPISNSASVTSGSYYNDINRRKFTVVPYGGFDGWDVYYEATSQVGRSIGSDFALGGAYVFDESDYNAYLEAYTLYEDTERTAINLFSTPGIDWQDNLGLVEDVITIVEEIRQDALYIIDAPDANLNSTSTVVAGDYSDTLESTGIDSSYAATYVPYVRRKDPDSNTNIFIPPTGEILKAMALADRTSFIWFATAGLNRGGLPNARDVRKTFKESDRDVLYLARLNPIVKFSNNTPGIFVYGQKTLQIADSKLDRIDVRRLLLYAKQIISSQARTYLFEPNDDALASNFIAQSNAKLKVIQDNRGLQTFRVRLDNTLNTTESRDRNEIYFVIELLPIGAVEFIGLTFVVNKSTSAIQFNA